MIGRIASGITSAANPASFGLVTTSSTLAPTSITALRSATETEEPMTVCTSSASAVMRDSSSPLRLRSKKLVSSVSRCAYKRRRRSATTDSPSIEMNQKRSEVATARTPATMNRPRKLRSMAEGSAPEKP